MTERDEGSRERSAQRSMRAKALEIDTDCNVVWNSFKKVSKVIFNVYVKNTIMATRSYDCALS